MRRLAPLLLLACAFAPGPRRDVEVTAAADPRGAIRERIAIDFQVPPARLAAWQRFRAVAGARWTASWDRATGVPSRIWGGSTYYPGTSASAPIAETVARAVIEQHLDLLAPGASPDDLELVTNRLDGRVRAVGFVQRHRGMRVVGGQLSVRFLEDRLYLISSQALPDVATAATPAAAAVDVAPRALDATARDLGLRGARVHATGAELVVVPLLADDRVLGYRTARPVTIDAGDQGSWLVYADPASGAPLVRVDLVRRADGTLLYDVPVRWPGGGRSDLPAARARVVVDGGDAVTDPGGLVAWATEAEVPLVASVDGERVRVQHTRDDEAEEAIAVLSISPAGEARWSAPADELVDAQLAAFVHVQVAQDKARSIVWDPEVLSWLDTPQLARVNVDGYCNANFNSQDSSINFYVSDAACENTGRLADVVYHELGHAVHHRSVVDGVGWFEYGMSEGAADFLAAIINADPGIGRGIYRTTEPLRDLDPDGIEKIWPDDAGEVHQTGEIYGGMMWDLRANLIAALGDVEGRATTERLFVATLMYATDIPSCLIELLAADDDDGDLGNGTPNECAIRDAAGRHGLRTVAVTVDAPGSVVDGTSAEVAATVTGMSPRCPGDEVTGVTMRYAPRDDSASPEPGEVPLEALGGDVYAGALPLPDRGDVVEYDVAVTYSDGTEQSYPENLGDPTYQLHRGEVIELYCHDFETDPADDGWTHGVDSNDAVDPWEWGAPAGLGGDPAEAYQGASVIGTALTTADGHYAPDLATWLRSPVIEIDRYSDVRLHYRRWLTVEDGTFDHAIILADGEIAWESSASNLGAGSVFHTADREWVFRDVPLSPWVLDQDVQLEIRLESDGGVELGGWTIDDLCVVADPDAICGDGELNGKEQCDDGAGNALVADACRPNCRVAFCGDGIVDGDEACDDANEDAEDGCDLLCRVPDDGGCCSSGGDPAGAAAPLAMIGLGILLARRRRRC